MRTSLEGRVALVTGASRGLGAAIAISLAERGAAVMVNHFRSGEKAEAVAERCRKAGARAATCYADVREEADVSELVRRTEAAFGPVDILVPNATGPQPFQRIEEQSWRSYLDQLEFFVKSPLMLVQATVGGMKQRRWGRIIQIGSEVIDVGRQEFANYVAAKGAQLGQTRSWAKELAPWSITVNYVAPGWIPTERHDGTPQAELDAYAATVPMQRQGEHDDVGEIVAYLASDAAKFITGQKISVNGGHTLA